MDPVLEKLSQLRWAYADGDPNAYAEIGRRIAKAGREENGVLTYSQLVEGITFRLPNVRRGEPFQIDVSDWTQIDRAIVGEFLGKLSTETYERGGFLAGALVVSKLDWKPSEGFNELLREAGLLRGSNTSRATALWIEHMNKAREWYSANDW